MPRRPSGGDGARPTEGPVAARRGGPSRTATGSYPTCARRKVESPPRSWIPVSAAGTVGGRSWARNTYPPGPGSRSSSLRPVARATRATGPPWMAAQSVPGRGPFRCPRAGRCGVVWPWGPGAAPGALLTGVGRGCGARRGCTDPRAVRHPHAHASPFFMRGAPVVPAGVRHSRGQRHTSGADPHHWSPSGNQPASLGGG